jgi:uncharacterized protein (DUF2236 family)
VSDQPEHRLSGSKTPARSGSRGEPTRPGTRIDLAETVKLISTGLLPAEIRRLFGFPWDRAREALLQSALLQLRAGIRLWPDGIRFHPAVRAVAGERYGAPA